MFLAIAKNCWPQHFKERRAKARGYDLGTPDGKTDRPEGGILKCYYENNPAYSGIFNKIRSLLQRYPDENTYWIAKRHLDEFKQMNMSRDT
jgi:hypothetical protein